VGRVEGERVWFLRVEGRSLPVNVLSLHEDHDGNLWLGTEDEGLHSLTPEPRAIAPRHGLPGPARAVAEAPDGSLWIATEPGALARAEAGRVAAFGPAHGLPGEAPVAMALGGGRVWLSYRGGTVA
jgi:ligand-binding sensor domain-containing protein